MPEVEYTDAYKHSSVDHYKDVTIETYSPKSGFTKGRPSIHLMYDGVSVYRYDAPEKMPTSAAKANFMRKIALHMKHEGDRRYIICNDGTIMCLYYYMGWTYDIIHPGENQTVPSRTMLSTPNMSEAFETMKHHAEGSYDGVRETF